MNAICFTVPGTPVSKARARVTDRGTYTPDHTRKSAKAIRAASFLAMQKAKIFRAWHGPVAIECSFYFRALKKWDAEKRTLACSGQIRPVQKADVDNLVKQVADAMNGVVYIDDSQIVEMSARKWFAAAPETRVTVKFL